jgi:hypothetical protein
MKSKTVSGLWMMVFIAVTFFSACSKDDAPIPSISFPEAEGVADNQGEYLLTGTILSEVALDKVILTKEGTVSPNLTIAGESNTYTDDSTAKNKNEYDFTYAIAGIVADTNIIMDIYDQDGSKKTVKFHITVAQ